MKFKLMNGATAMAILGGFGLATPALAQGINGPQYSTPAEQAETQRLNQQGIDGTTESPAVLNGEVAAAPQSTPYDQSGTDYPQAPNNGAPMPGSYSGYQEAPGPTYQEQRYNDQMLQYRNEQLRYRDQRNRYEMQRDRYERDRDWYAPPWWYDYP
ncbi:MAG TPA: hypothetical protein VKB71_15320 [Rhizomicrobium sp.]|nr:hypothetical protein [Rhizomicrobium sp.]